MHRDPKPGNVLGDGTLKIADFGRLNPAVPRDLENGRDATIPDGQAGYVLRGILA